MPISNCLLKNGIRLITEPIATTEAVAIGFWFSSGSRDEHSSDRGSTHFMEHLFFKGFPGFSSYDISRFFDRIGGYANAFTDRDALCVHCYVPRLAALDALNVLVGMVYSSFFSDVDFEREKTVIESEILGTYDDPEEMGFDLALRAMYGDTGLSRPVAGSLSDVQSLTGERLRAFRDRYLSLNSLVVTVAGNVDAESFARRLESIQVTALQPRSETLEYAWFANSAYHPSTFAQSQLFFSYPLFGFSSESDWLSLDIINLIIGDSVSSRLYQRVRENAGLCYSIGSLFSCEKSGGYWMASAAVSPENTARALRAIEGEIDAVSRDGVSSSEVVDAKSHLLGELSLADNDVEGRMKSIARQWFYGGFALTGSEIAALISSVDEALVRATLKKIFVGDRRSVTVFAPARRIREVKKTWK